MKTLFILNDAPYGNERSFNGLRIAGSLSRREGEQVKVFLLGDGAVCAKKGQKVPPGFYNIELMLKGVMRHNSEIGVCGACMEVRGMTSEELFEGAKSKSLEELTDWTIWADKVIIF